MVSTSSFRALLTLSATVAAITSAEYFQGDGTAYTLSQVSSGNCNLMSANSIAPVNYAALNNEQWNNLGNCGRCAQVSCIDSRCTNPTASAIVQIVDRCPECKYGDLDLSPTVFKTITGSDPSRLKIRWQFVDCPSPGTVKICLKDGSNGYWTAVQPTNSIVGIQSINMNDQATTKLDGAYYFVATSSTGANLNAVNVTVTSVNSDTIRGTYSLTAGQCVDTNQQFPNTSKCNVRRNRN
ncbi:hypothetical protein PF011_g19682 [Phytophthora fragariae]|uniref:Expansin-like EG45 domain-containing protein n=1 Tax=Phytophthora fragariae TaxID=53985 RepID=A0A6A3IVX7_9STRA|nr:hypothetical protein PF011_g19682 [Phytophthora fragariae]KAE9310306.1 hypothetical protein PF008_g20492 [Phytophthora fragariae]